MQSDIQEKFSRASGFRDLGMDVEAFEELRDIRLADVPDGHGWELLFDLAGKARVWDLVKAVQEQMPAQPSPEARAGAAAFLNRFIQHLLQSPAAEPKNNLN